VGRDAEGRTVAWPLPEGRVALGRKAPCEIVVDDPEVSSRHAELRREEGQILIVDLGSTNGTKLNGSPLRPQEPTPIYNGDRILVGKTILRLQAEPAASA
jgi:pSer/pThr/pTyr-binding forkhead associated (FHA) protein